MGKRQHQKDKMYITCTEYTHFYGGKTVEIPQSNFRRLPFDHCSLSLQPFEYPVCTPDGTIFDLLNIVPWIKKYGTNPITGEELNFCWKHGLCISNIPPSVPRPCHVVGHNPQACNILECSQQLLGPM